MYDVMISIPDEAYATAAMRARQEGFGSPEIFLSDFITSNITIDPDNYDYLFTPNVIDELDAAAAEARTGNNLTREQMRVQLAAHRQAWQENHPA